MLCELRIENLALIHSLSLAFDAEGEGGLVIMTGETGAGKSIMLRALDLLNGGRASTDWIRSGMESCTVEAAFLLRPDHTELLNQLAEDGLQDGHSLILRRSISVTGRSKLYVNGSMVTSRQLSELTSQLLSVAGQHEHQRLLQPSLHLDFLDTLGDLWPLRQQLGQRYHRWQEMLTRLKNLRKSELDKDKRRDLLTFQIQEIESAQIMMGEDELLLAEKKRLKNAHLLIQLSQEALHLLTDDIAELMTSLRRSMEQIVNLDPEVASLAEEIGGYTFQAEDYAQQLRKYRDRQQVDPYRLDQVAERLDLLQQLKRKYGKTLEEVLDFLGNAKRELATLENVEQEIQQLEHDELLLQKELCSLAGNLSATRREAALNMEKSMARELASLAFFQAGFEVRWQEVEHSAEFLRESGWDKVEFYFAANPGEPARPLIKVASGGELSRLMLAMKCLFAHKDMVDTVIFDEVDAGIGGEAAEAVARKIQELAGHHQVICITHLPQIAARGGLHFKVAKAVEENRTHTTVRRLSPDERIEELARMMAGEKITPETEAWARELLARGSNRR